MDSGKRRADKQQQTNDASHVSRPDKHRSNDWRNVEDIQQRHTSLVLVNNIHDRPCFFLPALRCPYLESRCSSVTQRRHRPTLHFTT